MVLLSKVQVVALHGSEDRQSVSEVFRRIDNVVMEMVDFFNLPDGLSMESLRKILEWELENQNGGWIIQDLKSSILNQAANVKENIKAEWFDVGSLSCRCSACGCKNNRETPFCPNCGVKMR